MSATSRRLRLLPLIAAASFVSALAAPGAVAQGNTPSAATLARQVTSAPVSLARGLSAAAARGNPISAKYEIEDGKPQLSVYTAKGNRYWEVVVDHRKGRIKEAKEIKDGDDLTAAKAQTEAMSKAKHSLSNAVTRALKENPGYYAVSAIPTVSGGHPVGMVKLVKGTSFKTVSETLN